VDQQINETLVFCTMMYENKSFFYVSHFQGAIRMATRTDAIAHITTVAVATLAMLLFGNAAG
jgi:hypothetical protein